MTDRAFRAAVAMLIATAALLLPAAPARADRIRDEQWHLRALDVAAAHRISQGEGVTVAVIDTGVDPHPDLRDNLLRGTDVVPGGTGDGRQDADGHGTAMAGLVAAHGRNGNNGAIGIAPKSHILPVRSTTPKVRGTNVEMARGIEAAIQAKADVISISGGGAPSAELTQAIQSAVAADIVVVAGVGNRPREVVVAFPAFLDGVLAVGATDRSGNRAAVSVTGDKLALMAPGVDIYSTSYKDKYYRGTGTSASTAIVAGAAALVRSKYPDLSAAEVVHRLTATATDKGAPGRDPEYGYGNLDLVAALTADVPPLKPSASPTPGGAPTTDAALPGPDRDGRDSTILLVGLAALLVFGAIVAVVIIAATARRRRQAGPARAGQQGS